MMAYLRGRGAPLKVSRTRARTIRTRPCLIAVVRFFSLNSRSRKNKAATHDTTTIRCTDCFRAHIKGPEKNESVARVVRPYRTLFSLCFRAHPFPCLCAGWGGFPRFSWVAPRNLLSCRRVVFSRLCVRLVSSHAMLMLSQPERVCLVLSPPALPKFS